MKKIKNVFMWFAIFSLLLYGLYPAPTAAQFSPFLGITNPLLGLTNPLLGLTNPLLGLTNPLLSLSYLGGLGNPYYNSLAPLDLGQYYYDTSLPIASYGQFDPSITSNDVALSLDILYSPTELRTYDPSSLQGLYSFYPSPFNYIWNSMLDQDQTINVNPYFANPFYYTLLDQDYFTTNIPERTVPLSSYMLYSFSPQLPELFYTAWQQDLAPEQSFINALGLSLLPII